MVEHRASRLLRGAAEVQVEDLGIQADLRIVVLVQDRIQAVVGDLRYVRVVPTMEDLGADLDAGNPQALRPDTGFAAGAVLEIRPVQVRRQRFPVRITDGFLHLGLVPVQGQAVVGELVLISAPAP